MSSWSEQLPDLSFTIGDKGIEILFRSEIYVLSIIEIPLSYEELRPFLRKNGLLSKNVFIEENRHCHIIATTHSSQPVEYAKRKAAASP